MALACRKALFEWPSVLLQFKRFRGKINIQKPRAPHFEKAKYLALTKPIFINPNRDKKPEELCKGFIIERGDEVENPFQRIIARELYMWLEKSPLIAFYHINPMSSDDRLKAYNMFKKKKMHFKQYGKKTFTMAVQGTSYETILDFYVSQNITVFSQEPDIKAMLKISKKFPQLILLAGILEGQLVSKDELMKYSLIPNLQAAQAGLVHTLNSIGTHLVTQLNSHQTTLVSHLQERLKQLDEENK